jgi:hemoglobin
MNTSDEDKTLYELLGGETGLRRLVERFYNHLDTLPEVKPIRSMHPEDLSTSIDRLFWFLSGWSGGPPLFHEKRGHPMLRARHLPFPIGKSERDQWMICMLKAVEDMGIVDPLKSELLSAFLRVADHMRNEEQRSQGT